MMDGLGCRVIFKCLDELCIIYKIILYNLTQVCIFDLPHIPHQFLIHSVCTFLTGRHIICRHKLVLICLADLPDIKLQVIVVADDFPVYFDEVHLTIICYPAGVRIPHFTVQSSCLILKEQVVIRFPVPGLCASLSLTQINVAYRLTFNKCINISHISYCLFLSVFTSSSPRSPKSRCPHTHPRLPGGIL